MKTIKLRHYIGNALIIVALVLSFIIKDAGWSYTFRLAAVCLSFTLVFEPDKEEYVKILAKEYFSLTGRKYISLPNYYEVKDIYGIASTPTMIGGMCCGFLLRPSLLTGITDLISSVIGVGLFVFLYKARQRTGLSESMLSRAKEEARTLSEGYNS